MIRFFIFLLVMFSLFIFTKQTEAKVLPQAKTSIPAVRSTGGSGIGVSPRIRADRRALVVNFANLQNAKAVSYLLTYKTDVQDEGAMGVLTLKGLSNQSVELLFGTCSKNVCKFHTGIKDAKLEVSYTLKSGKKYLKKYKIKPEEKVH